MCGIAGIVSRNFLSDSTVAALGRMQELLRHRGSDDSGFYVSPDRRAVLVHTRLSIIDLSAAAHQPMSTADKRYWIVFNGEIYNFMELRKDLEREGETFVSHSDTEVLLKFYVKYKENFLKKLRGMFAIAIWDEKEKVCFFARDPFGIKPLYYWHSRSELVFASELKALLASGLPRLQLSPQGLYGYLVTGSVPEPHTMIDGIKCLEAGHYAIWRDGSFKDFQYWKIDFSPGPIKNREAIYDEVRTALLDSVKYHFVGDRPVGIFLSGGVDSTALLALASIIQKSKIRTYSIAFEESRFDESGFARIAAKKFSSDHVELKMTRANAEVLLEGFLDAIDQPTIDGFNTFCISNLAHDYGAKVVISGLGADELFGGYPSYRLIPRLNTIGKLLSPCIPACRFFGKMIEKQSVYPFYRKIGDFLQEPSNFALTYTIFRSIFSIRETRDIMISHISENLISPLCGFEQDADSFASNGDRVSYYELSRYMRNQLLRDSDVMSMRHGLELRLPFVDRDLFNVLQKIPSNIRLADRKELLLKSVPELPYEIVNRKKHGFFFPFQQWLREGLGGSLPALPSTTKYTSKEPWYRWWSLFVLQAWLYRRNISK